MDDKAVISRQYVNIFNAGWLLAKDRGKGTIDDLKRDAGAKTPWHLTRLNMGGGTKAASFA